MCILLCQKRKHVELFVYWKPLKLGLLHSNWKSVKTQMKCPRMRHFIRVCNVYEDKNDPQEHNLEISSCDLLKYIVDNPNLVFIFIIWRSFYTPPLKCGEVLCYTLRCLSVRLSVRAHHFRSITWVFIHGIFSNFAYILLSAMSGMGLLMGKIRPFLMELLPFFVLGKWFLACNSFTVHDIWMKLHRYVAHQRLHIVTKDRHSDLPSLWVIRPW